MKATVSLVVILGWTTCSYAAGDDDTLRFYLSKSQLVVLGTIPSTPFPIVSEAGVLLYSCDFEISEVLKGQTSVKNLKVGIARFGFADEDRLPYLKKGAKCILFLKDTGTKGKPQWITADFWFGVQHPSPSMARSLKRLADAGKLKPAR
jgi:hypothetical protein